MLLQELQDMQDKVEGEIDKLFDVVRELKEDSSEATCPPLVLLEHSHRLQVPSC